MQYQKLKTVFTPCLLASALLATGAPVTAADLIVSTNDAKYQRVVGKDTFLENPASDTLDIIDASHFPPRVVGSVNVAAAIQGPPQAAAITPDGKLAIVSAPSRFDATEKKLLLENYLQIVDLETKPAQVIAKVDIGQHPQGLAINRAGNLLLAATTTGSVVVLGIDGKSVTLKDTLKLSDKRLAGITITPDGKSALVALRDEQGVMVLDIDGDKVSTQRERISTGIAPYVVDVASTGHWAVVGNVGLAGLPGNVGRLAGDIDSITLVDLSKRPYRAVQHVSVPALPEGVAISPDGRWVAVQSMEGSNLTADNPGRHARGKLILFANQNGKLVEKASQPAGEAGQGVIFTADNRYILAQFNVEKQLAVYAVNNGKLKDTGKRLPATGGPSSIRSMPR
ncbi:MAG: hypothetical protein H6R07_1068 [Proteobacteria bacterium]|nr:hypothetical protein [Pseudomonadota bacterium]